MREQIVRLAANYCVTAGAGAGKTTCLVDTYVNLLAGGQGREALKPEQVVAITFTEKAVGEMRERIQAKVAGLARGHASGPDWDSLLAAVEWAPITTIHSFCASLLREFAPVMGLDPDFAVLDEQEFNDLLNESLAELWREGLKQRDPVLARVLAHHGLAELSGLMAGLHHGLATQGVTPEQARAATAQKHEQAMANGDGLVDELDGIVQSLVQALNQGVIKTSSKFHAKVMQIIQEWPNISKLLINNDDGLRVIQGLAGLFSGHWGKVNELRQGARVILERLAGLQSLPAAAALADDLLVLAQRLGEAVERETIRRAALSFDHLLLLALRLVSGHPQVSGELRTRYRALLVDEFQDVNPVQGRLVRLLAGLETDTEEDNVPASDTPALLLVGDRKQSIYAFRGADVGVFSDAQQRFTAGAGLLASLPENYRSSGVLVEFFNNIFEHIFAAKEDGQGQALHFGPSDRQTPARIEPGALPEPIQVFDCRRLGTEDNPLAAWREIEAQALAEHLAGVIAGGVAPGDIAILFRRLTQVGVYEQALIRAGVDYYTVRGRGFYACREVADLDLALRAVLDPSDGLALAGFLRSPLAGLSDEALLALCFSQDGRFTPLIRALAEGRALPAWLGPEQQARLERARWLLGRLRPLARRLSPAELLACLVESTDLLPLWQATPSGEQRAANLRKLIEGARQAGPGATAEAFAAALADLVASPPEDPQAPLLGEQAPVVRLMSVHQAKGLQFPVVVLPDLAWTLRGNSGLALGPAGVLGACPWSPEQGKRLDSPVRKGIRERESALEREESARLFYVACTRAQERLVFCLNGAQERYQGPWAKWVRELVLEHPQTRVIEAAGPLGGRTAGIGTGPPPAEAWPELLPPEPGPQAELGAQLVARALRPTTPAPARVGESVSGLEAWLECPRLWFFTRRLGLDTASLNPPGAGTAGDGPVRAVELGSLVHRVLELADPGLGQAGLEPAIAQAAGELGADGDLARTALFRARGVWQTELPAWVAQARAQGGEILREQPFHLYLGDEEGFELEILGEFDLLARLPQNGWLLADYKVGAEPHPEQYRAQMALYSLALWQGQAGAGPLPRAVLCHLGPAGGALYELRFNAAELDQWRTRALEAGRGMAGVAPGANPLDLPPAEHCRRQGCALGRAGLCPGQEHSLEG